MIALELLKLASKGVGKYKKVEMVQERPIGTDHEDNEEIDVAA